MESRELGNLVQDNIRLLETLLLIVNHRPAWRSSFKFHEDILEVGHNESQRPPVDRETLNQLPHLAQALVEMLDRVDRCRSRRRLIVLKNQLKNTENVTEVAVLAELDPNDQN
jgi:dihydroxyacetone kinase